MSSSPAYSSCHFLIVAEKKMATGDDLQHLVLKGVKEGQKLELGRGAYGRVYEVKHCETTCAAKALHSILLEGQSEAGTRRFVDSFL